jgi:hypothetical protein
MARGRVGTRTHLLIPMTATFTGPGGGDPVAEIHSLSVAVLPTEGDMLYALQRQRSRILNRTAAGVDVDGSPFQGYTPGYAKQKAKYGRGDTVDLRGRNAPNMLQAMVVTSGSLSEDGDSDQPTTEGTIGFYDDRSAMLAEIHNEGEGHQPRRRFFAASDEELDAMHEDIGARIEVRLRGRAA